MCAQQSTLIKLTLLGILKQNSFFFSYKWIQLFQCHWGLPCCLSSKESACNAGDMGSTPGSGRSPGGGCGNLFQYSCQANSMDRGAWRATVHRVAELHPEVTEHTPWYIKRGQQFYLWSHYHHKYQHSEKGTYRLSIIMKTAFPSHTSWKRSLQATPWEPLNKLLGAHIYVVTISYLFPLPGNAFPLLPAVPNSDIPSSKLSLILFFPIWVALCLFCLTHILLRMLAC